MAGNARAGSGKLVELRDVQATLGRRRALRGVSWTVRPGEGWLLTGPNGAGKTTLLRVLAGRLWPDGHARSRRFYFAGEETSSPIGVEKFISWLSPEVHQQFARLDTPQTAGAVVLTGFAGTLLLTNPPGPRQRKSAKRLAAKLGVDKFWRRPFAELSHGQQRLVLLTRAVAPGPELLVLDEFSDGLDEEARVRVGAAITGLRQCGVAVIVSTHRLGDRLPGLTRHLRMDGGRAAISAIKTVSAQPVVLKKTKQAPKPSVEEEPILRLENAAVFVGDHQRTRQILKNISWTVRRGEHWAVLGANGSGKSTLLRTVYGELPVARGGISERFGKDAAALPLPKARQWMGFVSPALQFHYQADASVAEVVASGFHARIGVLKKPSAKESRAASAVLRKLGFGRLAPRRWGEISFGEARLALLARALVNNPRLLILDEPCDGLAPSARGQFLRAVQRAAAAGTQVIVSAHRREDLPGCVNRVLRLSHGAAAANGSVTEPRAR